MSNKEVESKSLKDKLIWYAKYGGIVAGLIGLFAASAKLIVAGVAISAGGFALGGLKK